jgi:hypothetical protein
MQRLLVRYSAQEETMRAALLRHNKDFCFRFTGFTQLYSLQVRAEAMALAIYAIYARAGPFAY